MRATKPFLALAFAVVAVLTQAASAPQQQIAPAPPQPAPSGGAIKAQTRLVTVDVVATDSHGKPVRGLTQDDFQVSEEHSGTQKIVKFRFVDASTNPKGTAGPARLGGARIYSNQPFENLAVPPSILLMDALNTELRQQAEVHRQMLMLLKTLPPNTPVAVFVLGHSLHRVQDFTTDPALLRSAVDRTLRSISIESNPQDDPASGSNFALDQNGDQETQAILGLEDFEKMEFEAQMSIRVDETTDAMVAIAQYLGGYPGRKNLLWFSSAFPNWIAPDSGFGSDSFAGTAIYTDKIRKAFISLTDARVAVYPVDARGLETSQFFSSAGNPNVRRGNPGGQIARENTLRFNSQATMEEIASATGGKSCINTNDLSGCVQSALDDSSAYYELAYYPENTRWDGNFHKITVKSNQRGIKLRYRSGYLATDPAAVASRQTPEKLLQDACRGPLDSTSIPLTAVAVEPRQSPGTSSTSTQAQAPQDRYLLTISTSALTVPTPEEQGAPRELRFQMAVCEYNPKGDSFAFYPRDLSRNVPDATYRSWQTEGFRNIFDYGAKPESQRLRFAVLDVPSGATGSVDVPAHPREFASAPASFAADSTSSASSAPSPAPPAVRQVVTSLTFKAGPKVSKLDWKTDKLSYDGDLGIDSGASAFFQKTIGAEFHCQSGSLAPNDATSTAMPKLAFLFQSLQGPAALVDLSGSEAKYSGSLPIDPAAKPFFDRVWQLCHCVQ